MTLQGYFIAGTDTGAGKTRVTVALLDTLRRAGARALGMKAVASGTDAQGINKDVASIRAANSTVLAASPDAPALAQEIENPYCFPWPISPHLAADRAGVAIEPAHIVAAAQVLATRAELLLVEGTGGWLAPIGPGRTMADIAAALDLPVVLVVGLRLGCLNHALLTARAIEGTRLRLAGWIGSRIEPDMLALDENVATLDERLPAPRLGLLPFSLDAATDGAHLAGAAATLVSPTSLAFFASRRSTR